MKKFLSVTATVLFLLALNACNESKMQDGGGGGLGNFKDITVGAEGGACLADDKCSEGLTCKESICKKVEDVVGCVEATDCPANYVCANTKCVNVQQSQSDVDESLTQAQQDAYIVEAFGLTEEELNAKIAELEKQIADLNAQIVAAGKGVGADDSKSDDSTPDEGNTGSSSGASNPPPSGGLPKYNLPGSSLDIKSSKDYLPNAGSPGGNTAIGKPLPATNERSVNSGHASDNNAPQKTGSGTKTDPYVTELNKMKLKLKIFQQNSAQKR